MLLLYAVTRLSVMIASIDGSTDTHKLTDNIGVMVIKKYLNGSLTVWHTNHQYLNTKQADSLSQNESS